MKLSALGIVPAERLPIIEGVPTAQVVSAGELMPTPASVTELNNTLFIPRSNATAPGTNISEVPSVPCVKVILDPFQKVLLWAAGARQAIAANERIFRRKECVLTRGFIFIYARRIENAVLFPKLQPLHFFGNKPHAS